MVNKFSVGDPFVTIGLGNNILVGRVNGIYEDHTWVGRPCEFISVDWLFNEPISGYPNRFVVDSILYNHSRVIDESELALYTLANM